MSAKAKAEATVANTSNAGRTNVGAQKSASEVYGKERTHNWVCLERVQTECALTNRPRLKRVASASSGISATRPALCSFCQHVPKVSQSTAVECEMKPMEQWLPSLIRYVRLTCLVLILPLVFAVVLVLVLLSLMLLLLPWSCCAV